ncbi:hypothetical protein BD410DRAFT_898365 [Rickenella mellea]|uniref:Uncharacterized protein n=1 Tax=Rickenella mellea TaxID=50990 RepID=A0A4Y7Q561_9AGAM|nr:hypothetical protein BD410DRAFT_898365 [Rickenella mellea]
MDDTRLPREKSSTVTGLSNFISLLMGLKNHDFQSINADEVWENIGVGPNDQSSSSCGSLAGQTDHASLRRSLDQAKLCMATLNEVQSQLRKRILSLRKSYIPLMVEEGIKTLPDDILTQVLEAGHYTTDNCLFAQHMSQVCHRFREVSLRTPLLWSKISDDYTEDQINTFLSRSAHVGLDISVGFSTSEPLSFLQRVTSHSNRWTKLRFPYEYPEGTMQKMGITDLPRLQEVYYYCEVDFPSKWSFSVSDTHGWGSLFSPTPGYLSQITSFEFSIKGRRYSVPIDSLLQAICSMKNLTVLSLKLTACLDTVSRVRSTKNLERHSVPIDTLQIYIKDFTEYDVVEQLYDALSFLSPSTIDLTLENLLSTLGNWPFYFLKNGEIFPYGSVINVRILGVEHPTLYTRLYPFGFLTELVQGCNIAHTIHVEARYTSFVSQYDTSERWKYFANLRHLRFTHCDRLAEWEIKALVENLMINKEPGKGLLSLEVINCPGISENFLLDLKDEVGSRLRWELNYKTELDTFRCLW